MFPVMPRMQIFTFLGATLLLISCGGGGSDAAPASGSVIPPSNTIYVGQTGNGYDPAANVFNPTNLQVVAGTTVTFTWRTDGHELVGGTVCAPDGSFPTTGIQSTGYTKTFSVPAGATVGTVYHFICQTHCSTPMACTVTVK